MSPDPLGYIDSLNSYVFGRGDPVNGRDPLGLADERSCLFGQVSRVANCGDAAIREFMASTLVARRVPAVKNLTKNARCDGEAYSRDAAELATWVDEGGDLRSGRPAGLAPEAYRHQSSVRREVECDLGLRQAPYLEVAGASGDVIHAKFDGV